MTATRPGRAWVAFAVVLALAALAVHGVDPRAIDWQPGRAVVEPWRVWTAAFVHHSPLHLAANLAGAALVAAFGWRAKADGRLALGWVVAWPLTQAGLSLRPDLLHYGGLSGVLHAGVALVAVQLCAERRWLGAAVLAGLAAKLVVEAPWGAAVQRVPGWDIGIAPFAHLSGAVIGVLCGVAAVARPAALHSMTPTERA